MGRRKLDMKILIQFPTRERPDKFKKYLFRYMELLENKENYEFHISCDTDDLSMNNDKIKTLVSFFSHVSIDFNKNYSKIQAYNAGVTERDWDIVIAASDDMWPLVNRYDNIIREVSKKHFPNFDGVLHFNDGRSGNKLNTLPIIGRKYYDRFGYIYYPGYKSFCCDNEADEISKELNKKIYIDQILIEHRVPKLREADQLRKRNHEYFQEDRNVYHNRKRRRLDKVKAEKKIISFSLYGDDTKYILGAIENVKLQPKIYPGWICRFYIHQQTVPKKIVDELKRLGCEIVFKQSNFGIKQRCEGMFWRYEVLSDRSIERCIVRDTDSRLSEREKICVDEWVESGKEFHIIRDHRHHGNRIMGGMWGITENGIDKIHYRKAIKTFRQHNKEAKQRGKDQAFLAQMIYPLIKNDVCIHDDYHFFKDEIVRGISHKKVNNEFIGEIIHV